MQIKHSDLKSLNISELLNNDDQYIIPVYQRNYEWGKEQIEQLLMDVKDYYKEESGKNYYIGTLIVDKNHHRNKEFETIDGQQRLTTINILCCAMKELIQQKPNDFDFEIGSYFKKPIISFESRKNADETLAYIFEYGSKDEPRFLNYNVGIFAGMKIAKDLLLLLKKELGNSFNDFILYFFEKVYILRVQVPPDTDMNHYFEIMNSRGEQLEKHEILKARLMRELNGEENANFLRKQFNYVWQACADMNSNLQSHFQKEFREKIFGKNWFDFVLDNEEELFATQLFSEKNEEGKVSSINFQDIVKSADMKTLVAGMFDAESINESEAEQFQPVINFENFLLHVLKIQEQSYKVRLDDKRLLSFFEDTL